MTGEISTEQWSWWAGLNEDEYRLAGPCGSREEAIDHAYGETEPGDRIFLVEARVGEYDESEGLHLFTQTRNLSSVVRQKDKATTLRNSGKGSR